MYIETLDATTVWPTPTTTLAASTVHLLPTASTTTQPIFPSPGDGDDGRDTLQRWSSLIGIVTAIVGNVLIALALNVQRYAHTRLNKERNRIRHRARAALKRGQSGHGNGNTGGGQTGSYGAIASLQNGSGNGHANGHGQNSNSNANGHDGYQNEADPLSASFQSDVTNVSNDSDTEDGAKASTTYLKSPYWWLGQILITLGEMGNFLAYGFAPASIVSPLGVVALVSNCIIAPVMFHEKFRARDFWGVVIAVAGVVTVVLSAKQEETKLNPSDILDAITTMEFEIYLGVTVLLIVILMWASPRYGKHTILIDLGLVGLFGGYTALATKGVSSMLSATLWRAFTTPITYVLLVILLGTAIMQIRYVNKALQRFDSTQVIPIQFVLFTLCVILGSAVLYRDFEKTTGEQAIKFVGGCLLTFFGVFLITSGRQQKGDDDDDDDMLSNAAGVEETIGLMDQDGNPTSSADDEDAPVSRSRRSSRLSRASVFGNKQQHQQQPDQDETDASTVRYSGTGSSPAFINPLDTAMATTLTPSTPPRGVRTISTDSVAATPSSQLFHTPVTPLRDAQQQQQQSTPGTDRPVTSRTNTSTLKPPSSHNRSRPFISPSPFSSTFTTVVKDALRDNDNATLHLQPTSSMRRIRSSIRASLFFDSDDEEQVQRLVEQHNQHRASEPAVDTQQTLVGSAVAGGPSTASDDHLVRTLTEPQAEAVQDDLEDAGRRRTRSFSETLGGFFRSKKKSDDE